jgi:murein endopeptidase
MGSTASHSANHWGTPSLVAKLGAFAAAHFLRFSTTSTPKVAINDISLEQGGLFDIGGGWNVPHREHRVGLTADMRSPPPARSALIQQMLIAAGITGPLLIHVPPDAPHWHLRETTTRE